MTYKVDVVVSVVVEAEDEDGAEEAALEYVATPGAIVIDIEEEEE
jgi:hypothetical protein